MNWLRFACLLLFAITSVAQPKTDNPGDLLAVKISAKVDTGIIHLIRVIRLDAKRKIVFDDKLLWMEDQKGNTKASAYLKSKAKTLNSQLNSIVGTKEPSIDRLIEAFNDGPKSKSENGRKIYVIKDALKDSLSRDELQLLLGYPSNKVNFANEESQAGDFGTNHFTDYYLRGVASSWDQALVKGLLAQLPTLVKQVRLLRAGAAPVQPEAKAKSPAAGGKSPELATTAPKGMTLERKIMLIAALIISALVGVIGWLFLKKRSRHSDEDSPLGSSHEFEDIAGHRAGAASYSGSSRPLAKVVHPNPQRNRSAFDAQDNFADPSPQTGSGRDSGPPEATPPAPHPPAEAADGADLEALKGQLFQAVRELFALQEQRVAQEFAELRRIVRDSAALRGDEAPSSRQAAWSAARQVVEEGQRRFEALDAALGKGVWGNRATELRGKCRAQALELAGLAEQLQAGSVEQRLLIRRDGPLGEELEALQATLIRLLVRPEEEAKELLLSKTRELLRDIYDVLADEPEGLAEQLRLLSEALDERVVRWINPKREEAFREGDHFVVGFDTGEGRVSTISQVMKPGYEISDEGKVLTKVSARVRIYN